MNFREKLARLGLSRPFPEAVARGAAEAPDGRDAPSASATRTALGFDAAKGAALPDDRTLVLSELRRKMAEVMGRPSVPRPLFDPSETCLPFTRIERDEGILYRRLERLAPSHHVGRIPVDSASSAHPELIALIALDPGLAGIDYGKALFLDIETTGLGMGAGVLPFLVGLSWFDAQRRLHLEQLLLRRPCDEPALLERLRECLSVADVIVTYNGKTFDWPLLETRYIMNRLRPPPRPRHLDLLHVARRLHKKRLGPCRLVSLESGVLGFARGPDVEGAEVAARYAHFLRTGDERALEAVVGHNAWDVVSLAALLGLYGEPLELLASQDLVGLARTLRRAGALERAAHAAERAVERGAGASARQARGEIAKARGDRASALRDFESLLEELDDPGLRLELAKLYEHHVKAPGLALSVMERGTGESEPALLRRRSRLERKAERIGKGPVKPKR